MNLYNEYDPLLKIQHTSALQWLIGEMELVLEKNKSKLAEGKVEEAEKKINLLTNTRLWIYRVCEESLGIKQESMTVSRENLMLCQENIELKKENDKLKKVLMECPSASEG